MRGRTGLVLLLGVVLAGGAPHLDADPMAGTAVVRGDAGASQQVSLAEAGRATTRSTPTSRRKARRTRQILRLEAAVRATNPAIASRDRAARNLATWLRCVSSVGVDEAGDPARGSGFALDARDGTGESNRRALTVHRGAGRPMWTLLTFRRTGSCRSAPTRTGGTADAARRVTSPPSAKVRTLTTRQATRRVAALRRAVDRLEQRVRRDETAFDRWDEWESCLEWLPTTQRGDAAQDMGFRYETPTQRGHLPAIGIDHSSWDDPDYQLLAFKGAALPFTRGAAGCDRDPGESADRVAVAGSTAAAKKKGSRLDRRIANLKEDLQDVREDVADLQSPIEDFQQFDECMYTVGVSETGVDRGTSGYVFTGTDGRRWLRSALSFDLDGFDLPQHDVLAFPGEEPPQIECNEDAGGVDTDE